MLTTTSAIDALTVDTVSNKSKVLASLESVGVDIAIKCTPQEVGLIRYLKELESCKWQTMWSVKTADFIQPQPFPENKLRTLREDVACNNTVAMVTAARDAMIVGAQRRLIDSTFPPKLRLKVLRAGVLDETSDVYAALGLWKRLAYKSVFGHELPDPIVQRVHSALEPEAEQALSGGRHLQGQCRLC